MHSRNFKQLELLNSVPSHCGKLFLSSWIYLEWNKLRRDFDSNSEYCQLYMPRRPNAVGLNVYRYFNLYKLRL